MGFTPAMQQYVDTKREHPDCILFFRMGDFYETFFEDAKVCSKLLDIVLTSKNKGAENPIPMAGIPYHSVDKYITKLIHHGYKIAIAEQTTDPIPGKIVEREVVSIITPGTYIQESKKDFTTMLAISFEPRKDGNAYHIAWGDFGIGEYHSRSFSHPGEMQKFILTLKPVELIIDMNITNKDDIVNLLKQQLHCIVSIYDIPPNPANFVQNITGAMQIASYGRAMQDGRLDAVALLFHYLRNTQKSTLTNVTKIAYYNVNDYVLLDEVTIKNLELLTSTYEGNEKYSLIHILDTTQTTGGSRLLRDMITRPIRDRYQLQRRLSNIQYYRDEKMLETTSHIHQTLKAVLDIPKIVSSILYKKLSPSAFIKLRATLRIFCENKPLLDEVIRLGLQIKTVDVIQNLFNYLQQVVKDDADFREDMDFIRDGYDTTIDELRKIAYHSDDLLMQYQQELVEKTGVSNVKVKYVINQGYFLEITNKDIAPFEKALESYDISDKKFTLIRRNTLKGGQRYSSPYLEDLQEDILKSKDNLRERERDLLVQAEQKIMTLTTPLQEFAEIISWLDVFTSHALLAKEKGLVAPEFVETSERVEITAGKHPVIEAFLPKDQQFIPNDLAIKANELHIITGPNMGGKSTYLRQNALIILMAHCGLFVPAEICKIGLVDAIFARIGSGDIIARNQSTFMTEMIEVANILNNASKQSFIIFDELGRGTSTYDGLALTKAILEYVVTKIGAKTLIATHYHELIKLEQLLPGVKNFSVSVYETDKEVVFMKKIIPGGASKSYGLDVAKLAGIASPIIQRAKENLTHYEGEHVENISHKGDQQGFNFDMPDNLDAMHYEKIKNILSGFDLNNITPLQALQLLAKIKDELEK